MFRKLLLSVAVIAALSCTGAQMAEAGGCNRGGGGGYYPAYRSSSYYGRGPSYHRSSYYGHGHSVYRSNYGPSYGGNYYGRSRHARSGVSFSIGF
jgi:hypothetical protein